MPRNARHEQVEAAIAAEVSGLADGKRWRGWGGRGQQPTFAYTTEKVQRPAAQWGGYMAARVSEGWVSYAIVDGEAISSSFVLHATRKAAKARAWNLWQGYRLARGLTVSWRSFA